MNIDSLLRSARNSSELLAHLRELARVMLAPPEAWPVPGSSVPVIRGKAGISGGRTSALMAYLLPPETRLVFTNTGREHSKTLDFLRRLEDDLQRPIYRVEFRAPKRGDPPKFATFELVPHEHLSRKGEPFTDFLLCLASFRAKHKGLGPIAPWARSRLCTSYMKVKTAARLCASWGWDKGEYTDYIGLRADEPVRVRGMEQRNRDSGGDERSPLAELGVRKEHVLRFFGGWHFDLGIPEHLGNCVECFMKDESDLAEALLDPEALPEFAIAIENDFGPMRRGPLVPGYAQVLAEAPYRRRIRTALECGVQEPEREPGLSERRHRLIVKQERKVLNDGRRSIACSCDAAPLIDDDTVLDLP